MAWKLRIFTAALVGVVTAGTILVMSRNAARSSSSIQEPEALPVYGQVPDFELVNSDGRLFSLAELRDKIWVADFIFTHCAGPCPLLSRKMARLAAQLEDLSDVRFVSFSVDPERDTPQVLSAYARRFGADTSRWSFLTGSKDRLYPLIAQGFKLAVDDGASAGGLITHSTRFVLVDRLGQVRGYFEGAVPDSEDHLAAEVRKLAVP